LLNMFNTGALMVTPRDTPEARDKGTF